MKTIVSSIRYQFLLACILVMGSLNALAQDNATTESHTSTTQTATAPTPANMDWMNNPWIWIGGGVVLLLLLYAVFSGSKNNSKSEVKRTTTVTTEVKND